MKNGNGLALVKTQGDSVVYDPETFGIPVICQGIQELLEDFAACDIYNCDELALQ